jgi:hypothetical protein
VTIGAGGVVAVTVVEIGERLPALSVAVAQ